VLRTGWAAIVVKVFFKLKNCSASCCGTPGCGSILLDELIEGELLEFLFELRISILTDVTHLQNVTTLL